MLTLKMLNDMPAHTIFASGMAIDNEEGLFMTGSGKELRWVAVRGGIDDWAIYCHFADKDWSFVRDYGDKVTMKHHIKNLVSCTDEAFKRYRY